MHLKNKIPIVSENASMKTIIIEMTKKSFGHVGVINHSNKLVGIITDGDLRRHMNKSFLNLTAKLIMTTNPILISKNELVLNALNIMNRNKITCLFVTKETKQNNPEGIIHIHDCLRYVN